MRFLISVLILFSYIQISLSADYKNEIIIKYKKDAQIIKTTAHKKIKNNLYILKVPKNKNIDDLLKKLQKDPDVEYAEPNYIVKKADVFPNDPLFQNGGQWALYKINAPKAWDLTIGSNDIYVAVVDTGVDYNHLDLKDNIYLNEDERNGDDSNCSDGIDDDGNGYIDDCYGFNAVTDIGSALDDDGHGTHLSGIIGAVTNNNFGVAGINWHVKIIPCKFLDDQGYGDIQDEVECIEYIKSLKRNKGLNIVAFNASYGGEYKSVSEKEALKSLRDEGIIVLAAAGNDGKKIDTFSPCTYNLENEICIGATNKEDKRAGFSNYDKEKVYIYAPGSNIYSTYKNGNYATADGTSQATPFVTGAVALLKSYYPTLSIAEIKRKLLLTGKNLINLSGYSYTCNRLDLYDLLISNGNSAPKLCLDKIKYDFGFLPEDSQKTEEFIVRSTGEQNLEIYSIYLSDYQDVFQIQNDNCSSKSIPSLSTCNFEIKMIGKSGNYVTTVILETNAGNIQIIISGSSNSPPEIIDFKAIPSKININEKVHYSWEVMDKDGDPLKCQFDFDGNGTIDKVIFNCETVHSYNFEFKKSGTFYTKFYVTDGVTTVNKSVKIKVGSSDGDSNSDFINIGGCSFNNGNFTFSYLIILLFFLLRTRMKKQL